MATRLIDPLDVSQDRLAPLSVLTALREIQPMADLVHVNGNRWLLVTVDGADDLKWKGRIALENAKRMARGVGAKHPGIDLRRVSRIRIGLQTAHLKAQGARFVDFYTAADPDGAIVEDFRRADFLARHDTESEFWRMYDTPREQAREAALRDLTDEARANDVWQYANTLNHHVGGRMAAAITTDHSSTRRVVTTIS